jgi:hypothetical protein
VRRSILLTLGCIAFAAPLQAAEPAKLIVQPDRIELRGPDTRHGILVTAVSADGRTTDVTRTAVFSSSKPDVVALQGAECRARGDGEAIVTVRQGDVSAEVKVVCTGTKAEKTPSFLNDVMPVFTKLGCNQGACHGKGAGQNGFRLSLRGYAPEQDYEGLTREFLGRRSSPADADSSPLLRKPLGQAPHEGGKLFDVGSRAHQTLLDWLRADMPAPAATDPTIVKLDILPGPRGLRPTDEQQLLVRAAYTDGSVRDVTWLTKFDSNDPGVASVDVRGRVQVLRHGETSIRAAFGGLVAVVVMTAPNEQPVDPARLATKNNFIDDHVFAKLAALRIEPSDLSSDAEFLRRVYLDAAGVLPTPEEIKAFLDDKSPDKRARAIDALLERPEFVDHWALFFTDLFQNRKERDHDVRGPKGVRAFHEWLRQQVARNRPWDELAREVITAQGAADAHPAVGYFVVTIGENGEPHRSEVVASAAQAFLGTRIGCAQCHNHPLERYTQDDYYHFAAYFSRIKFERHEMHDAKPTVLKINVDGENKPRTDPVGVSQPRTGRFMKPQPLDRAATNVDVGEDPRVKLANWMTDPNNESFSGAMVNRIWKHYLGVGLVEPVDDIRASNPPSNPELWQALNRDFVGHHFDLKHLMRMILNSRTYQLTSATRPGNETDARFYSHYYARRLPAEVLLDALSQSTGVPEEFTGYPRGIRAAQMPDTNLKSYFLPLFGKSDRVTACACERSGEVTMPQLLHLQNGQTVVRKINDGAGRLNTLLRAKVADDAVVDDLYLATLSRPAPDSIKAQIRQSLATDVRKGEEFRSREEVFRDLFWALLNSKEFSFNH